MSFVDRLVAPVSTSARARLGIDLLECGRAAEGFRHLAHAARNGCIEAQYRVGRCYLEGTGVPQATAEAVRWLERAAEAGSLDAQFHLALLYVRGVTSLRRQPRARRLSLLETVQAADRISPRHSSGRAAPLRAARPKAKQFLAISSLQALKPSAMRRRRSAGTRAFGGGRLSSRVPGFWPRPPSSGAGSADADASRRTDRESIGGRNSDGPVSRRCA